MQPEDFELAAEFCKLVGAPDLLTYLGIPGQADPVDARTKLKARRKFMQGMQGNPKYKREALFLIKHFTTLNTVLGELSAYLADAGRRAESVHLPVVEMTIRGALAGGSPSIDQVAYLRRNALELGVSEETFGELLARIGTEMSVVVDYRSPTPLEQAREVPEDLYQLLGIAQSADDDDVRIAYTRRIDELDDMDDPLTQNTLRRRVEVARKVLSNDAARRHYDLTAARTGPPARARERTPFSTPSGRGHATAPPVRDRSGTPHSATPGRPGRPARLEILGEPTRAISVGRGVSTGKVTIRNGGEGALYGRAWVDVPWARVDPVALNPELRQQSISVHIDGRQIPPDATAATVTIATERGERARVVFELKRRTSWLGVMAIASMMLLAALMGVIAAFLLR